VTGTRPPHVGPGVRLSCGARAARREVGLARGVILAVRWAEGGGFGPRDVFIIYFLFFFFPF
jgi:hypothetical protein